MKRSVGIIGVAAALAFGIFVGLAQTQTIFVPYFTPTSIEFEGLQERYPVNSSMSYSISLKGYGSNCIAFEAEVLREDSSLPRGEERVAYYSQTQDCRKIDIAQSQYNYTKSFSYSGDTVLGKPGSYRVDVSVFDQITKQDRAESRSFIVV
jgi:hypothetical protein